MTREELLKIAKPMLFNTDMVRAILEDRKTVTRRAIKPQPPKDIQCALGYCTDGDKKDIGKFAFGSHEAGGKMVFYKTPCKKGDILYARETWCKNPNYEEYYFKTRPYGIAPYNLKWKPSIHMPKEAARIFLRVTDVGVERLQDIEYDGVVKEGIHYCECPDGFTWKSEADIKCCYTNSMGAMAELWDSTIKNKADIPLYGWNANPWVWVIEFERIKVE